MKDTELQYGLYVIYDRVAEEAGAPIVARTDGLALRMYQKELDRPEFAVLRQDMTLYRVGYWNPIKMLIRACDPEQIFGNPPMEVNSNEG